MRFATARFVHAGFMSDVGSMNRAPISWTEKCRTREGESNLPSIELHNATALSTTRLLTMFSLETDGWRTGRLVVYVRHTRSADYSGTCYYDRGLIYVN